jgi:hypothetical protein
VHPIDKVQTDAAVLLRRVDEMDYFTALDGTLRQRTYLRWCRAQFLYAFFIIGQIQLRRGENRFLLLFDISFSQRGVDLKGIEHKMSIVHVWFSDDSPAEGRQRLMVLEIGASNNF